MKELRHLGGKNKDLMKSRSLVEKEIKDMEKQLIAWMKIVSEMLVMSGKIVQNVSNTYRLDKEKYKQLFVEEMRKNEVLATTLQAIETPEVSLFLEAYFLHDENEFYFALVECLKTVMERIKLDVANR